MKIEKYTREMSIFLKPMQENFINTGYFKINATHTKAIATKNYGNT